MPVQLKRNDTKDTIGYSITNADGTPVNLTGATVRFIMGKGKTLLTNAVATIVNAASGSVEYTLTEEDTLVAGKFNAEFEVTFSDGKVKTFPNDAYIAVTIHANIDNDQSTYIEDQIAFRVSDIQILKNSIQAQLDEFAKGDSSPEVAQARIESDNTVNTTLKARLDKKEAKFTSDIATLTTNLAQKATKATTGVSRLIRKKVLPPAAFTWQDAPINIYKNPIGEFSTDFDVSKFQHVGAGKTYYVDFKNGLDTNDGLTQATALKSLGTAVDKSDVDIILIASGLVDATGLFATGKYIMKNITIKALPGADVTLSVHGVLTWTLTAGKVNTYQAPRTALGRVFDANFIDADGDFKELTKVNSIDEVEVTPNSYYWASNILYVRTFDSRVPDDKIRGYLSDRNGFRFSGSYKFYLEGLKVHGGIAPIHVENTAGSLYPEVYAKNCEFKYPTGTNVVNVRAAKLCYFQNCVASRGVDDGFNYHKLNEVVPNVIEVNCIGRDNGTSSDTDNGSTMHEGGKIIRVNGQYYRNKGSNVGDINWSTQSWNLGCVGYDSKSPLEDRYKSNFTAHENATMWLDGCASYESLNAATAQINAFIYKRDCVFEGAEFLESTGKILEY